MNILVFGHAESYSVKRFKEEADKKGYKVTSAYYDQLRMVISSKETAVYINDKYIETYDVIVCLTRMKEKMRNDISCMLSFAHTNLNIPVINSFLTKQGNNVFSSSIWFFDQLKKHQIPFVQTAFVSSLQEVKKCLHEFTFPLILKDHYNFGGMGVYKIENTKELEDFFECRDRTQVFSLQSFIENEGDIRLFTINHNVISAIKRVAKEGEYRNNLKQGAKAFPFNLEESKDLINMAQKASEISEMEIAGIDIIIDKKNQRPYILEVNSFPLYQTVEKLNNVNLVLEVINYLETLV